MQSAFARQRPSAISRLTAIGTGGIGLASQHRQEGVFPQLVVIAEVLVAQSNSVDPLTNHLLDTVLNPARAPMIEEAGGEPAKILKAAIRLPQQKTATIRTKSPAIKPGFASPSTRTLKVESPRATVCSQGLLLFWSLSVAGTPLIPDEAAPTAIDREKCGLVVDRSREVAILSSCERIALWSSLP